jgi:hypothetical protein
VRRRAAAGRSSFRPVTARTSRLPSVWFARSCWGDGFPNRSIGPIVSAVRLAPQGPGNRNPAKRGQVPFVRSTLRAIPAKGTCPARHLFAEMLGCVSGRTLRSLPKPKLPISPVEWISSSQRRTGLVFFLVSRLPDAKWACLLFALFLQSTPGLGDVGDNDRGMADG